MALWASFTWGCSSVGQSAAFARQKSRVRIPPAPQIFNIREKKMKGLYEKRYKTGLEYSIQKWLGLKKPNGKIKAFYFALIALILISTLIF